MKKIYKTPLSKTHKITPQTIIAASPTANDEVGNKIQLVNEQVETSADESTTNLWNDQW